MPFLAFLFLLRNPGCPLLSRRKLVLNRLDSQSLSFYFFFLSGMLWIFINPVAFLIRFSDASRLFLSHLSCFCFCLPSFCPFLVGRLLILLLNLLPFFGSWPFLLTVSLLFVWQVYYLLSTILQSSRLQCHRI